MQLTTIQLFQNHNPPPRTRTGLVASRRRKHSNFCNYVQKPLSKTESSLILHQTFFCRPKSLDRLIRAMIHSLDFWLPFYQEKGKSPCGGEPNLTAKISDLKANVPYNIL